MWTNSSHITWCRILVMCRSSEKKLYVAYMEASYAPFRSHNSGAPSTTYHLRSYQCCHFIYLFIYIFGYFSTSHRENFLYLLFLSAGGISNSYYKNILKKLIFFIFFILNLYFLMFLNYFDALISKIIFKNKKNIIFIYF
jgi:hypothetical protein